MSRPDRLRAAPTSFERLANVRSQQVEAMCAYLGGTLARAGHHGAHPDSDDFVLPLVRPLSRWRSAGGARDRPASTDFAWGAGTTARHGRVVVLAPPGTGKTKLLYFEAGRLAHAASEQLLGHRTSLEGIVVPIMVGLTELSSSDDALENALVDHAVRTAFPEAEWVPRPVETLRLVLLDKLRGNACVVLLDGWDRVPLEKPGPGAPIRYVAGHRQRLGRRLADFALRFPGVQVVLASRIEGYTGAPFEATHLELLG